MAATKSKYFWVVMTGTGMNQTFLVKSHVISSYSASTYHVFTFPNGNIAYKNDFGVSDVVLTPVMMTDAEALKAGQ